MAALSPPRPNNDLGAFTERALSGTLSAGDIDTLESVQTTDTTYTRSQLLLYQQAKANGNTADRERYITAIIAQPQNQYKPEYLVESAALSLGRRDYVAALSTAQLAERHWARLPPALIYTRKAAIYELEAAAHTGLYYSSEGDDPRQLEQAIWEWQRYRQHVSAQPRQDLVDRADAHIAKLTEIQERMP